MRIPPSAGPIAAPNVPAAIHVATPRARDPVSTESSASAPASSIAAPAPCTHRNTISAGRLQDTAAPTDPAQNRTRPPRVRLATFTRLITGINANAHTARTRLYEVITHETPTIVVLNLE